MDELKRAADDMTEAEVARARAQMKAGLLMGLESPSARAERMARLLAIWGRVPELSTRRWRRSTRSRLRASVRGCGGRADRRRRSALALYGPVAGAPGLERSASEAGRLMLGLRRRVRIETERMTLRLPQHADFRAWAELRAASRAFLTPWEPVWAADHLARKAFTNRVYWAQRAEAQGTALPLLSDPARGRARCWAR